ncbi:MAG: hypothetical protein ACK559_22910, partial [bacterium]
MLGVHREYPHAHPRRGARGDRVRARAGDPSWCGLRRPLVLVPRHRALVSPLPLPPPGGCNPPTVGGAPKR